MERTEYTYDSSPDIVFNDITDPNNWYRINSILLDTEVRNVEDPKMDEGIEEFTTTLGKGLLQMEVSVFAESEAKLNELLFNLKKAFNPVLTQENVDADDGYLPFKWTETIGATSYNLQAYAKPLEIPKVVRNWRGTGAIVKILCKIKEPKKVGQTTKTITLNSGALTGTNDNDGDMGAYPVITITGPTGTNPKVLYNETGEFVQFNDTLTGGQVVVIDCKKSTVKKDGVNAYGSLATTSTFFKIKSGTVTLIGTNVSTGSIAVTYRDSFTL